MDDDYGNRQFAFGRATLGGTRLDFYLAFDGECLKGILTEPLTPSRVNHSGDREMVDRDWARREIAHADQLESALRDVVGTVEIRATDALRGPSTAGPGIEGELIRFFVDDDPLGHVADALAILGAVRIAYGWLRTNTGRPVVISDGMAVLVAASALGSEKGNHDVTVHHCTALHDQDEPWVASGYLVGLITDGKLFEVVVSKYGAVASILDITLPGADAELGDIERPASR